MMGEKLNRDKVTVDDALISTDVDNLIKTIAQSGKIALKDLRSVSHVDKRTLDKWLTVLEEEGYVNIEYNLGATYIHWAGPAYEIEDVPEEPEEDGHAEEDSGPIEPEYGPEPSETPQEQPSEEEHHKMTQENISPLVDHDLADKRPVSLKSNILSRLDEDERPSEEPPPEADEPEEPQDVAEEVGEAEVPEQEDSPDLVLPDADEHEEPEAPNPPEPESPGPETEPEQEPEEEETEPQPPLFTDSDDTGDDEPDEPSKVFSQARAIYSTKPKPISSSHPGAAATNYLREINNEKAEIERLRKEKEALYTEKLANIESRMDADLAALGEAIVQKQARIAELKDGVLALPDKLDEIEEINENLRKLRDEGRSSLVTARERAEKSIRKLTDSRSQIAARISELDSMMEKEEQQMKELEDINTSVTDRVSDLNDSISELKAQLDDINSQIGKLRNHLDQADSSKAHIESMASEVKETISGHADELRSLESQLGEIAKIEQWIKEYVADYETKIEEIEDYIEHGEDELADLRESAEAKYLTRYLNELERLTAAYHGALDDAVAEDHNIDAQIEKSRSRIVELVKESQGLIRKVRESTPPSRSFDEVRSHILQKTEEVKSMVEEKTQERAILLDDAQAARIPPKPKPRKAKAAKKKTLKKITKVSPKKKAVRKAPPKKRTKVPKKRKK